MTPTELEQVVAVRWTRHGPLVWCRAPNVAPAPGDWVVVNVEGTSRLGRVAVGHGQCLGLAACVETPPLVERVARPDEIPSLPRGAGQQVLATIPGPANHHGK